MLILNLIPGLSLRVSPEDEIVGIDDAEIGEFAYDYVELTREVSSNVDPESMEKHGYPMGGHPFGNGIGPSVPPLGPRGHGA